MYKLVCWSLLLFFAACTSRSATVRIDLPKGVDPDEEGSFITGLSERDTASVARLYPEMRHIPAGWKDVHVLHYATDFPQALYQAYRSGAVDRETCMWYFRAWGYDTTAYTPLTGQLFISLAVGIDAAGDTCLVFDAAGDRDFANDTPVHYRAQQPVAVAFERYDNQRFLPDTAWVQLTSYGGRWLLAFREQTAGTANLHGQTYRCRVKPKGIDYRSSPLIYWTDADTVVPYAPQQYARLGDRYYRIDSLTATGRSLFLTETPDALQHESMQEGFRPYSFTAVTLDGQPIRFPDDFRGKTVLLDFWSLGCAPCRQEIRTLYPALYSLYHDSGFEILGVADDSSADLKAFRDQERIPWLLVADRDSGRALQKLYSVDSYPTLCLVGPEGKISVQDNRLRGYMLERTLQKCYPDVPAYRTVTPEHWSKLLEDHPDIQLVDVRTPEEFADGIIPGARNIDAGQAGFDREAEKELDLSRPVAVYCRSGVRSRKAAVRLVRKGYTVYNLDGGYEGWKKLPGLK